MPEVEVCIGEIKDSGELFSRSKAVNRAYLQATKDIIVIADSDIVYDPNLLKKSITYVNDGQWVIPFSRIASLIKRNFAAVAEATQRVAIGDRDRCCR